MNKQMPRTPFSTQLSGSARETEIRLKNIFSGPKKRPPVLFLVLMFSVCVFCGNLVSCQLAQAEEPDISQQGDASPSASGSSANTTGAAEALAQEEQALLEALVASAGQQQAFQLPEAQLLTSTQRDNCILGAAFVADHLENTLILGVMDRETGALTGPVFRCGQHTGVPNVVTFWDAEGRTCLLYTFNGQMNGQYTGEAGVVRFDGGNITWTWPVEGDVRDEAVCQQYRNFWSGHLALMSPGGVDVYEVNPDFVWGKDEPVSMWQIGSDQLFYDDPSSSAKLPMPVYFQALNWLVGYTADPGGWRITSLSPNPERADLAGQTDCFTLQAQTDNGNVRLTADLFFAYETEPSRPRSYSGLVHAEVRERDITLTDAVPDPDARKAYTHILENLLHNAILPDRTDSVSGFDNMTDNTFAVADVDGDGREELVLLTRPDVYAGYMGYILDHHDGALVIQHKGFPSFTFYSNGAFKEDDSHAQGSWTSQFWPHSLYRYLPETDSYEKVGHVDAWEKDVSDHPQSTLPPFPSEKDKSGAGILFYITPAGALGPEFTAYSEEPVDQSVYLDWLKPYLGDARPIELNYLSLTEENIARLK